jgi:hypothetical protein
MKRYYRLLNGMKFLLLLLSKPRLINGIGNFKILSLLCAMNLTLVITVLYKLLPLLFNNQILNF